MKENKTLDIINERRAIRSYEDKVLSKEEIDALTKAALMSPSARNVQPWHISVLTDREIINEWEKEVIQYFIDVGDDAAVKHNASRNNKIFYDAPAVFVISMVEGSEMDVGIMAANITIAAKSMGLDSVILGLPRVVFNPMNENEPGKWEKTLKFPEDYFYGISVAVGYGNAPGRDREPDYDKLTFV